MSDGDDLSYMSRAIHAEAALGKLVRACAGADRDALVQLGQVLAENAKLKTVKDITAETLARAIAKRQNGENYEGYESTHCEFAQYLLSAIAKDAA